MDRILVNITSFVGQCTEAIHYYVSVSYYRENKFYKERITRPITQAEIDSDEDRFYSYEAGEPTECFMSWRQAVELAKKYIDDNALKGDIYVDGVPNNETLTLEQALFDDLDTRKKCSKCGKVFKYREGYYNFPSGALCVNCHDIKNN